MLQHGSYTLLIDACYDREQFPTLAEAMEWTWASNSQEVEAVTFVLRKFFVLENDVYVQKRIQEEISEYHSKAETNKRIAKERETLRSEKRTDRERIVNGSCDDGNEPPPNHKPLTNNHKPITTALPLPDFINPEIWEMFKSHRGAKFSTNAKNLTIKDLTKAQAEGNDPNEMLEKSIANGWKGVFTPRNKIFKPVDPDYMRGVT